MKVEVVDVELLPPPKKVVIELSMEEASRLARMLFEREMGGYLCNALRDVGVPFKRDHNTTNQFYKIVD